MITKKRLQELINEGAFIFYIYNERSIGIIRLDKSYGISVDKYNEINKCKPVFYRKGNVEQDICDADKIFETKAQAEWYIKYHATRTEELDLPTWEEFKDYNKNIGVSFVGEDWVVYEISNDIDIHHKPRILLTADGEYFEEWKATEENYTKACDLCLKLFKED